MAAILPETEKSYILEVNDLTVKFHTERGENVAVNHSSFKVRQGETVGIVGESGSGKSVTAMSLMRLIPHPQGQIASGEMWFNSPSLGKIDLAQISTQQIRELRGSEMAMIFQESATSLNPVYSCGEQVMENILLHERNVNRKEAKARTIELFKKVKLPRPESMFNSYPHELSGGQKQRVMIAMALSCNPSLLIADEPTTALDVTVQSHILELVQELKAEKAMSIVFITHDLGVVGEIADRVIVMYKGTVVEEGTVWDIFSNPKHPYTKGLLACRPRADIKLKVLPVVADFMTTDAEGNIVETNKFTSVGQALMMNYQSGNELREKHVELMKEKPLLSIKNLKVHFPIDKNIFGTAKSIVKAVDGVSFDVFKGETLGLVGESGCGKTTLGRTILRLVEATSGEIFFDGQDIRKLPAEKLRRLRKDVQIIFQDPYSSLNPRMTVGETIMEPMRIHKVCESDRQRKEKVIELLETVNLKAEFFNRYPHEFSGGQRQRICIARTLAIEPKFVICDESVSALDVSVQAQVLNLLNGLKQKFNLTYIFVSHDLSVIKFISDRIMVMNMGQIEEIGFGEDVYAKPQREYTKKLIASIPKGGIEDIRKRMMLKRKQQQLLEKQQQEKNNLT
jgi:peptide/nickel transport system ATP-binding protein